MNPARSLGPALVSGTWADLWVYLLAPLLGAVVGAFVYRWLRDASRTFSLPSLEAASHTIERDVRKESMR
jgi:hypothetical protein